MATPLASGQHQTVPVPAFSEGFEGLDCLAQATCLGDVARSSVDPWRGQACLLLQRSKPDMERVPTSVTLPSFPVHEGIWNLSMVLRCVLHSPDSSYNGTVRLEILDVAGTVSERDEVAIISGEQAWKIFRKRVEIPEGAQHARFVLSIEKTWGSFAIDDLSATFVGPSLKTVRAITFASDAVGNLFLPEQALRFTVSARCKKARAADAREVICVVRDYWGAEFATRSVQVGEASSDEQGKPVYTGTLDLSDLSWEVGKYYEIHAAMSEPLLPEPTRDTSSFAVLPEAITKQHPPFSVPFTASGWNPGVPGFFPLCDRIGMRVANVYSRWSAEPPYQWTAPGIEIVKELGMGALLSTPVHHVEIRGKGWEKYDATAMREGAKGLINAFKDQLPLALRVGNEPHPVDDADVLRMIDCYRAVYQGAKEADPNIVVTATSCGPEDAFFRLGYQDTHDVYIFHQYADAQVIRGDFQRYEAMVAKYGKRRPVWSTELGLNSQGMARGAVAGQLIKIFTNFFACGGQNGSWFGIMWPDPDGRLVGTNGDSFDIFNSKYCLYSPKITAVAEYHLVNAICIKKFVSQRSYPDGTELTLFRDEHDRCLVVAWNDAAHQAVGIPLPGVGAVRAVRLDGAGSNLDAAGKALTLALLDEPYLLEFTSADFTLPDHLAAPSVALVGESSTIVKGGQARLVFNGQAASTTELQVPPGWSAVREKADNDRVAFLITAPSETAARTGRLLIQMRDGSGELLLPIPVEDALGIRFRPAPFTDSGAGMTVELVNRGSTPQQVSWSVNFDETYAMTNGTFALKEPQPFVASFATPSRGNLELQPGANIAIDVRADNLDPLALYHGILELDVAGHRLSRERLIGGCAGIPKITSEVRFDGRMGDAAWQKAVVLQLNQPGQFAAINKRTARWDGPEDLSATMHLLWDDQYLYLGMRVRDDVFCQPEVDANIWRGDGLQFLVDPCRDTDQKPGKYDYIIAKSAKGDQAWSHASADPAKAPSGEVTDFRLTITPSGERGGMIYEVAIPWHRLSPFVPKPGANLGLAMIVNNDDGHIRDSFMAWFGCAHSKQLSMNGDLILL